MRIRIPTSAGPDVRVAFQEVERALRPLVSGKELDFKQRRIINAARAVDPFDYATLDDVRTTVENRVNRLQEELGTATTDTESNLLYGTHADRIGIAPVTLEDATMFFETDRVALYQVQNVSGTATWVHVISLMQATYANRPSDLDVEDENFTFIANDRATVYEWSGAAWFTVSGMIYDTYTNRPATTYIKDGVLFMATDYGKHIWRCVSGSWVLLEGHGLMRGTLSPDQKPSLGSDAAGFLFYSTDFARHYRWSGSAWVDVEQDRGMICWFDDDITPSVGWALCDGSSVTRSTSAAGTTSWTVPDMITDSPFVRGVSGTTRGTGGAETDVSSQPSSTTVVDVNEDGLTSAVGSFNHTHTVDTVPPYIELRPYVRL